MLMTQLAQSGVRFAVGTGDTAYPSGTQTNYGDLRQTGTNVSGVFAPQHWKKVGASIPFFNATGNHGFNSTFLSIWPQATAASSSSGRYAMETYCCVNGTNSASYPSAWYAFDAGNARFYVLEAAWSGSNDGTADEYKNDYDTHWTPSSPEYQWLQNDLQTHPSQLKFAFFHFPMYSSNATEASDTWLRGPNSLEGLLARNGVDIGFSGHAHNYTRNVKPSDGGLVTYVTGGGGARLQPATRCGAPVAYAVGWSYTIGGSSCGAAARPTSIDQVFHFLKVSVDGAQVTVAPTDSQGRTFDVQTYDFSGSAPPPPPPPPARHRAREAADGRHAGGGLEPHGPDRVGGRQRARGDDRRPGGNDDEGHGSHRLRREPVDAWPGGPARRLEHSGRDLAQHGRRPGRGRDGEPLGRRPGERQRLRVERGGPDSGRGCVCRAGQRLVHHGGHAVDRDHERE